MTAPEECPFCSPDPSRIILETPMIRALWDGFPVSPGHALIVPRRHVASWFDASPEEHRALLEGLAQVREEIQRRHSPEGFNIGVNVGEAAGQTVFHLHVHLIPRYRGDVPNPRGGVRHVIPHKADYKLPPPIPGIELLGKAPHDRALIRGEQDPLLHHLAADLPRAIAADIAVAFTVRSGLELLGGHIRDLVARGGRLRFLTGDYLDFTEPEALERLLDLLDLPRSTETEAGAQADIIERPPNARPEIRVFHAGQASFHPKAFLLHFPDRSGTAYVGSSNLTRTALTTGVEWNYRVVTSADPKGFGDVVQAFGDLFQHPSTQPLTQEWIRDYATRRPKTPPPASAGVPSEPPPPPPQATPIQGEALKHLQETREAGNSAGLIVLATGLGKTYLSAFDSDRKEFRTILFVAHREEILTQAMDTFRRVRPSARMGRYDANEKNRDADILFSSVATLGKAAHLREFPRDRFDYIVVDEFHHAAARTYRKVIDHFTPKFLLGLTATPDRTDGNDLLALCQENLVYTCALFEGIERDELCPFDYYGVPDEVDYDNIPWRSSHFDETELTAALATEARAKNCLEQYHRLGGKRTLAFCCSQRHADFMAEFFRTHGVKALAVHSGPASAPRTASLDSLKRGEMDVLFAVDMFSEGVDVPSIDTVIMLRPTESAIVWVQQFGRGLRKAPGKDRLRVIDYIGNHRIFLTKVRTLLNLKIGDQEVERALALLATKEFELPPGCSVTYELRTVEILRSMLQPRTAGVEILENYYRDFLARHGERPTAAECFHDGFNPKSARTSHGSWIQFVDALGGLTPEQKRVAADHGDLLREIETTAMTRSSKMILLRALLNLDQLPGEVGIGELTAEFRRLIQQSEILRQEVADLDDDAAKWQRYLEINPIAAWTGRRDQQGRPYFSYDSGIFATRFQPAARGTPATPMTTEARAALQELIRELVEWRIASYLARNQIPGGDTAIRFRCKVSHATDGRPILFLPDRKRTEGIPEGWMPVRIDGKDYEANFAKIAINVIRPVGSEQNVLGDIARGWFGPDAGRAGTRFAVEFTQDADTLVMRPVQKTAGATGLEPWREYSREEIPPLFGLQFSQAIWNAGFIPTDAGIFLLVTLEKGDLPDEHGYADRFLDASVFEWKSQNRTTRASKHGQLIQNHAKNGTDVHLFVRRTKKIAGRPTPFTYCGPVQFVDWEGDNPITVRWRLPEPIPESLTRRFKIPSTTSADEPGAPSH